MANVTTYTDGWWKCEMRCVCITTVLIAVWTCTHVYAVSNNNEGTHAGQWRKITFHDTLPSLHGDIRDSLFKTDYFSLLGQIITLICRNENKGYVFRQVDSSVFSIKSRKTIQEQSRIHIETFSSDRFDFHGILILKKGITFACSVKARCRYRINPQRIMSTCRISYNAPEVVKKVDDAVKLFTGKRFVAYKMAGFIERMNRVLDTLDRMSPSHWKRLAGDEDISSSGVFPVRFTDQEIAFVADLIATNARPAQK